MTTFRIGDYVRSKRSGRIQHIGTQGEVDAFEEQSANWERVTVRLAKARRTLTLSRGLNWLMRTEFALATYRIDCNTKAWHVWSFSTNKAVASGTTPLKAIIAARKTLGVKS
jgi:hypothetical protein